jgi:hypothetical protein
MQHVTGSMVLGPSAGKGDFSVNDRVYQFRGVPISGAPLITNDPRLNGSLDSTWNWDVDPSGQLPVPAWGSMRIEVPEITTTDTGIGAGAWAGDFTAIRNADNEPFLVRAMLFGEGAYEGLCATLDFRAGTDGWLTDGVIHQVPMAG